MSPRLRIALRYLFAPKSHTAVNVITMISMAGVAVAAMAMVCVLSVFNGFKDLAGDRLSAVDPDIKVTLRSGAMIADGDSVVQAILTVPGVAAARQTIEQRALASSNGQTQLPVRVRGVEDDYSAVSTLGSTVIDGTMIDSDSLRSCALLSVGTAVSTGARPSYDETFCLTVPRRLGRINPAFPMAAFLSDTLMVSGVYQTNQSEYDEGLVYIPIATARHLFDYPTEASSIDIAVVPGADASNVAEAIGSCLGESYLAADRLRQQQDTFRMIRIEKWITFLILIFILVIASFNIVSALC
ncbi:MAG: ABC transporter permease, partial [Duncaniella sp.]|nr:ABC transporter permease [Duncaniella sp.]